MRLLRTIVSLAAGLGLAVLATAGPGAVRLLREGAPWTVGDPAAWRALAPLAGGGLLVSPAAVLALHRLRRALRDRRLRRVGRLISANLQALAPVRGFRVLGRRPVRIVATWRDPATLRYHVFRSAPLWRNPEPYLPPGGVPVRIDPDDPRHYRIELADEPGAAHRARRKRR